MESSSMMGGRRCLSQQQQQAQQAKQQQQQQTLKQKHVVIQQKQQQQQQQKSFHVHNPDDINIIFPPSGYNNSSPSPPPPQFLNYLPPTEHSLVFQKTTTHRKLHRYPENPDTIEICNEPPPTGGGDNNAAATMPITTKYRHHGAKNSGGHSTTSSALQQQQQQQNQLIDSAQNNWPRGNITATMERYEPSSSSSSHSHTHQDYSYAYYEPGAAMRHSNVPIPGTSFHGETPGPSRPPPPPNSMRALLSKGAKNAQMAGNPRHTYTTRYGTQENIYEEIVNDERMRMMAGHSMISLNQSMVEEEFRRVQSRHRRILGELNLSVEAMIMPTTPPNDSPTEEDSGGTISQRNNNSNSNKPANSMPHHQQQKLGTNLGASEEMLSPVGNHVIIGGDLDSGFSGSSSGASYIGSLRYHKSTNSSGVSGFPNMTRSSTPSGSGLPTIYNTTTNSSSSIRSSQRSHEDTDFINQQQKTKIIIDHLRSAEDPGPSSANLQSKTSKTSFWRKGWRKFPGFSSTTSVNKAGTDEPKLNSGSWEDPLPLTNTSTTTASLSNATSARRSETVNSFTRHSHNSNTINLGNLLTHNINTNNSNNNNNNNNNNQTQQINSRRRLEHTPSARTISSEESWCSEVGSERDLSSDDDDDDESDRSITSTTARNSQLRSTLNKAKHHLSFDKWRNGNRNSTGEGNGQMPSQQETITTPGESPGGRLSRWFSIRRGSTHQYEVGGNRNSIENDEPPSTPTQLQQTQQQQQQQLQQQVQQQNSRVPIGSKMPQVPESEEDPNNPFGIDLSGRGSNILSSRSGVSRQIPPTLPPAPAGLSQQQIKRRYIVAAIVHSENSYVATLQRLVNDYKKPLEESSPPILSQNKISTLFHRLPEILQCHTLFRIALADCVRNWDRDEKIGDVFIASFSKPIVLDIYSGFINNFSSAMELAKMEAKRKSALSDFLKVKQISAHDRLSFFGLMVKPVQRFPQFILFLQDLLKYTPQGHHDRMSLQLALTQLESLAEMLNERKREAEQYQAFKEMLGHISGTFNTRALSSDGNRHRYLLREDNVTQLEFNQAGFIVKSKQRRLLLLNDKVICVSVAPKQSHDFGATEKLSFKWMLPVAEVEIVDNSTSATLSRLLTAGLNRGGSLKSNSSASGSFNDTATMITNGADNLCNEMSNLMHDYEVMSRINDLVGMLKGAYKDISQDVTKRILTTIQSSIQKKDEEMAWVDSCCLQLIAKNKSGKEESYTFQTENPSVKKEWVTELRLAQLALDTNNSPAWEIPEHEQRPLTKMPLFVKAQSVYKSQHQTEVRCGCYYTITNNRLSTTTRRSKSLNYVWICTSDGTSSHITTLQQHHQQAGVLRDIGSFDLVETQVTAMEFIKCIDSRDTDTIWMATDSRKIYFYDATNPSNDEPLGYCSITGVATQILYVNDNVVVSLTNGNLLIFSRTSDGVSWLYKEPVTLNLGSEPVPSMLSINNSVYAACGKNITVLNPVNGEISKNFEIQHAQQHSGGNHGINLMAHSGVGLWVSLKNSSIICLYHTESFKHLQDINIASNVLRVTSSKDTTNNSGSVVVTALMASKGLLWVGTNVGIALTIPLPRLEGVPIISGGVNISYHAHFGPITFLLPLIPKSNHSHNNHNNQMPAPQSTTSSPNNKMLTAQKSFSDNKEMFNDLTSSSVHNASKRESLTEGLLDFSGNTTPVKKKLEKQSSIDYQLMNLSAKFKSQLTNSPVMLRRKTQIMKDAEALNSPSRISKTLPRGLGSARFFSTSINSNSSSQGSEQGCCDVYGLYGDLIFVKEDYDHEEGQGNLMDPSYESLRRSDPELAAIPAKVSTLDRRLRMKVSRPRSLDLSNWSVESRSSSLYTSSGSEESMAMRHSIYGRSVSRNSSSASHKTELNNITENSIVSADIHSDTVTSTPISNGTTTTTTTTNGTTSNSKSQNDASHNQASILATLKKTKKGNKNQQQPLEIGGRRTIISLMGGRGYINWRHVWYSTPDSQKKSSMSTMSRNPNSNDAHIVIWEKKL